MCTGVPTALQAVFMFLRPKRSAALRSFWPAIAGRGMLRRGAAATVLETFCLTEQTRVEVIAAELASACAMAASDVSAGC